MNRLHTARFFLARTFPYLASGLFAMRPVFTDEVPTMAVDHRWRLYINPEFIEGLSTDQAAAVLYHELLHLLRNHHDRRGERNPDLWNVATDLEINDDVREAKLPLPEGVLYPEQFQFDPGLLAETYYQSILANATVIQIQVKQIPGGGQDGSGAGGRKGDWELSDAEDGVSEAQGEVIRRQVAEAIQEAVKNRGTVPGHLQRWAEAVLTPKVNWRAVLRSLVRRGLAQAQGRSDYRLDGRNRRAAVSPVILPRLRSPLPRLLVLVDTSGSMSDSELSQALTEIGGITRSLGVAVDVASGDTQLETFQRGILDPRKVQLRGGGGTDLGRILTELGEKGRWDLAVVLTDGYTPWPAQNPFPNPVLVVTTGQDGPWWATTIRIQPGGDR